MRPGSSVVEQGTENPRVGSSILPPGTMLTKAFQKIRASTI